MLYYAVKSVDNKSVNRIFENWNECKALVWGKKAVYKSFTERTNAEKFIVNAPTKAEEYGHGYIPNNAESNIIYGRYLFDRFATQADGYGVKVYETSKKERITCRGYFLPDNKRLVYSFTGQFINDKKYGYEFEVENYTEHVSNDKDSIITYLSSGVIKGIGLKKAQDIYKMFGSKSLTVLETTPEKLIMVKGISRNTLEKIVKSYNENKGAREITKYLLPFGISPKMAMSVYRQYGFDSVNKVKENPYVLCMVKGLTFEDADRIADHEGFAKDADERFIACAMYVLKNNEITGSTGMELNDFGLKVYNSLNASVINPEFVNKKTIELINSKKVRLVRDNGKQFLYTSAALNREKEIAQNIIRIYQSKLEKQYSRDEISDALEKLLKKVHICLDEIQKKAVIESLYNSLLLITGSPGTGKTTIIYVIKELYKILYPDQDCIFLAPTGRAATKISESTNESASTEHSYLKLYDDAPELENEVLTENSLIVVDEFSMTDVYVAHALFNAIGKNNNVVIVGDPAQLPSVGPGKIMADMINSNVIPIVKLENVYRQNEDSQIYLNAIKMRKGNTDIKEGNDFHFVECSSMESIKNAMAEKYMEYVEKYGVLECMCICPYKKHTAGVHEMNQFLQEKVNPASDDKKEVAAKGIIYREGDVVMHLTNTDEVSNGDIGLIKHIYFDNDGFHIQAEIEKKPMEYTKDNIDQLTLAYAVSVHKSQGSQAKGVVTCLSFFHREMLFRNIPYVAFTRASDDMTVFGEREALNYAITHEMKSERHTLTLKYLVTFSGNFIAA